MNNRTIAIIVLFLIIIHLDLILPLSTISNYAEGAEIHISYSRDDVTNYTMSRGIVLYNVEPQWGFAWIALLCDYDNSPKCTLENRTKADNEERSMT